MIIGDEVIAGLFHKGICVGPDRVVHNAKGGEVEEVSLREFAAGRKVGIVRRDLSPQQRWEIAARARRLIGLRYDLINFNCESVVNYALTGEANSPTVAFLALVLLGFVAYKAFRTG